MDFARHQRLPVRLPSALEPAAGGSALQFRMFDGPSHEWIPTKDRPKIAVCAGVCRRLPLL
jgi:hypothetical protein